MRSIFATLILICGSPSFGFAFSPSNPPHIPPNFEDLRGIIEISLNDSELNRARLLVGTSQGYVIYPMTLEDGRYVVRVRAKDIEQKPYQFQVETNSGEILETKSFIVESPGARSEGERIATLSQELTNSLLEESSIQTKLKTSSQLNEKELQKRKDEELAQALILLGEKERELKMLKEKVK